MAMQITDLEAQAEAGLSITPGTQKAAVLRVLVNNPEMAFTPSEIADRSDIPAANAPMVCRRLADMGAASNRNGHYYLPQDEATATNLRRALGRAHQQDLAQKTAEADESDLRAESEGDAPEQLSDGEVDSELADLNDELIDI